MILTRCSVNSQAEKQSKQATVVYMQFEFKRKVYSIYFAIKHAYAVFYRVSSVLLVLSIVLICNIVNVFIDQSCAVPASATEEKQSWPMKTQPRCQDQPRWDWRAWQWVQRSRLGTCIRWLPPIRRETPSAQQDQVAVVTDQTTLSSRSREFYGKSGALPG